MANHRFEQYSKAALIAIIERFEVRVREEQTRRQEARIQYGQEAQVLQDLRKQPAWRRAWRGLRGQL